MAYSHSVVLLQVFICWTQNWRKMGSFNQVSHEKWRHDDQSISEESSRIEDKGE
jgi:hypothetical protein